MSTCQAIGCTTSIASGKFMCRPHWFGLPAPLRQQINACWRSFQRAEGDARTDRLIEHAEASDEAIRLTAEAERLRPPTEAEQRAPRLKAMRRRMREGASA